MGATARAAVTDFNALSRRHLHMGIGCEVLQAQNGWLTGFGWLQQFLPVTDKAVGGNGFEQIEALASGEALGASPTLARIRRLSNRKYLQPDLKRTADPRKPRHPRGYSTPARPFLRHFGAKPNPRV